MYIGLLYIYYIYIYILDYYIYILDCLHDVTIYVLCSLLCAC